MENFRCFCLKKNVVFLLNGNFFKRNCEVKCFYVGGYLYWPQKVHKGLNSCV